MKGTLLFIRLDGKKSLVIGAGNVARRKIFKLIESGSEVTVVTKSKPGFLDGKATVIIGDGFEFVSSHVENYDLIVAATDNKTLNAKIARLASEKGKLVNVVTDPELSTFVFPAVIDYGSIKIGVTTSGTAPIVSKTIKKRIEKAIPREEFAKLEFSLRVRKLLKDNGFSGVNLKKAVKELECEPSSLSNKTIIAKAREIIGQGAASV